MAASSHTSVSMGATPVMLDARGRIVIPAAIRRALNVDQADEVVLTLKKDGTVLMQSAARRIKSLRGRYQNKNRNLVAELIAERAAEAEKE